MTAKAPVASPITVSALVERATTPMAFEELSPLGNDPFLLVDPRGIEQLQGLEAFAVADWLRRQLVPTIAVGVAAGDSTSAFDVVAEDTADVAAMLPNLRRCPQAASVLVQLLRATETLPLFDALVMESLAYAALQSGPEFRAWLQTPERKRGPTPDVSLAAQRSAGPAVIVGRDGDTLTVELNRPARRNAISVEVRDGLVEALKLAEADESIWRVRISGRGRCFSVGGDLEEFGTAPDPVSGHAIRGLSLPARALLRCVERTEFHVHGACIGAGIELPAFSPRLIAKEDAFFQLPELRFGLIPGAGGCVSLPQRIGRQRTALLVLTGRRLNAATALEWGLVDALEG